MSMDMAPHCLPARRPGGMSASWNFSAGKVWRRAPPPSPLPVAAQGEGEREQGPAEPDEEGCRPPADRGQGHPEVLRTRAGNVDFLGQAGNAAGQREIEAPPAADDRFGEPARPFIEGV